MCKFCGSHPCECLGRAEEAIRNIVLGTRERNFERFQNGLRVHADLYNRFTPAEWLEIRRRIFSEIDAEGA